jgi:hypothetical protein
MDLPAFWERNKSIFIGAIQFVVGGAYLLKLIDMEMALGLLTLLNGGSIVTMAMKGKRTETKIDEVQADVNTIKTECK